jgi:hypothetical protein
MRHPRAVVGLVMLLPAVIVIGCSDLSVPTDAPRMSASASASLGKGSDHAGAIIGHDSCDPASFNAALNDPTACVKPGPTTFQEFIGELSATQTVRSWRFNPLLATTHAGEALLVKNVGGEVHTFTPVEQFGGGFIQILNDLSGNPVPAPECLNVPGLDFVAGGASSLISGAALAAVADASGIAKIECCLHPWMRSEVRIK